jgi:hypothetical protein
VGGRYFVVETKTSTAETHSSAWPAKNEIDGALQEIDESTLIYEFTVDDPVWTKPLTVQVPWAKSGSDV